MTRDEAHFCCRKYGMALMSIRSFATNTFLSKSLKESQHATIWLGIFNDPSNVKEMVWFNSTAIEYNNFNSPTKDILDGMAANKTNSTDLCMYAEVTDNMIWKIKHCEEKLDFGCEIIGPDIQVLPASLKDVICPDLLKMTSDDITRGGVILSPNSTKNTKETT
nr:uncharacterized protein LOC117681234 [Crassostrea gigas]